MAPQQVVKKLRQPLKYPKRSASVGVCRDGGKQQQGQAAAVMICRFHNYDPINGCKRFKAAQAQVRKRSFFVVLPYTSFTPKAIILPRQAWDKHRGNSKKGRFLAGPGRSSPGA